MIIHSIVYNVETFYSKQSGFVSYISRITTYVKYYRISPNAKLSGVSVEFQHQKNKGVRVGVGFSDTQNPGVGVAVGLSRHQKN